MKHVLAEKWDRAHHNKMAHYKVVDKDNPEDAMFVPINRPCDWCGRKTKEGWIHIKCAEKERDMYLDILY